MEQKKYIFQFFEYIIELINDDYENNLEHIITISNDLSSEEQLEMLDLAILYYSNFFSSKGLKSQIIQLFQLNKLFNIK